MVTTINDLPIEMLELIMSHLPDSDKKTCRQVCRIWYDASYSASLVTNDVTTVQNMQDSFRPSSRHPNVEVEKFDDAIKKSQYSSVFWTEHGETIRSLTIEDVDIDHPALAEILQNCQNLKILKLTGCRYSLQEDQSWKTSLRDMALPSLRELHIDAVSIDSDNLINALMTKSRGLRRLSISGVVCKDDDSKHKEGVPFSWPTLTSAIERHSTTIEELEITDTCLTGDILEKIVNALGSQLTTLNVERIKGSCLDAFIMEPCYIAISRRLINLKMLNLDDNKIDENTSGTLLRALTKLQEIALSAVAIPRQVPFLKYHNDLTYVDLSECHNLPSDYLIDAFASYKRPKMKSLDMSGIMCVDDALLAQICPMLPNLELLFVASCDITDTGFETICRSLPTLEVLSVCHSKITRLSGEDWSINDLLGLDFLDLSSCSYLNKESIRELRLERLEWLEFDYEGVASDDLEILLDACPVLSLFY